MYVGREYQNDVEAAELASVSKKEFEMAEKKKTILMGEGASEPKEKKRWRQYFRSSRKGVGGTIGEIKRERDPKMKVLWHAGLLRGKSRAGFQIKVNF
jgi:hypothetical protein